MPPTEEQLAALQEEVAKINRLAQELKDEREAEDGVPG